MKYNGMNIASKILSYIYVIFLFNNLIFSKQIKKNININFLNKSFLEKNRLSEFLFWDLTHYNKNLYAC